MKNQCERKIPKKKALTKKKPNPTKVKLQEKLSDTIIIIRQVLIKIIKKIKDSITLELYKSKKTNIFNIVLCVKKYIPLCKSN